MIDVTMSVSSLFIGLNNGWTWLSFNVEMADMSINSVLGGIPLAVGDHVKNQHVFADFYDGFGFFGLLESFTNEEMYAVKLAGGDTTLTVSGTPTSLPKTIRINTGW